ncbi:ATP-binding protein [Desulfurivibrio alkaliphilus]|uniref:histidine kinase n=1 Tax=Desulfurivibrio alkaliphilus (strain DSM 19089 / UNIQEM U267 / AHT2) TaxID=589865 RepID=D6Z656_DESAT|nr:ATP-binding protein [Desulfurivibrio alkaliphilus]ADH86821.1 multi-sensor hybrid histidine kinase [Desulfurivibrio alkaliphilus AHT 2]
MVVTEDRKVASPKKSRVPPSGSALRRHVLLPLGLALLLSIVVTIFAGLHIHSLHVASEGKQRQWAIQTLLPTLLNKEVLQLHANLNGLASCPNFQQAWLTGDLHTLEARMAPIFDGLKSRHEFIDISLRQPDHTLFLHRQIPLWAHERSDSEVLAQAVQSGDPAHGLELDPTGILLLRLVHPLRLDGKTAGFIDLSVEIHGLTTTLQRSVGSDIWLVTAKEQLDRQDWLHLTGPGGVEEWGRLARLVVLSGSRKDIPPALRDFMALPREQRALKTFTSTEQGWPIQGGQVPLRDATGHEIGEIFFLDDTSGLIAELNRLRLFFLVITGSTAITVFTFLFFFLGRIQATLLKQKRSLLNEIDSRKNTETALRRLQEDLERQVAERTQALGDTNQALQREVAERQQTGEELRRAKEEWEETFNAMADTVTILDPELRIVRANRATGELWGQPAEQLVGRHCYELYRDAGEPCEGCPVAQTLADHRQHICEIEHSPLGKTFLVSASPLIGNDGVCRGVVHVARDITVQKEFEAKLQQTKKMEAVGTLAAGIAHDFNNILTGILSYSELILRGNTSDPALRDDISRILELGRRGAGLTRQLLAFSREQEARMQPLKLNELVENLMKTLGRLIGEDIEVTFNLSPDLGNVNGDPGQLEQVILNLVVNARDAMPTGGTIVITTGNVELDAEQAARHPGMTPGPHVMLTVSDTGSGMDPETQEHIFEPFFTTKEVGAGTGLGLATVYGIIQQHQGSIWVYSEIGGGTVFKIFLPQTTEPDHALTTRVFPDLPEGRETILLVEDEAAVRDILNRTLATLGYKIITARDPAEAEELFTAEPEIDLLFTDVIMPGGNGMDLYQQLAAKRSNLKVLFMSGYNETIMKQKKMDFAGFPFIQKPFATVDVVLAVRNALDNRV